MAGRKRAGSASTRDVRAAGVLWLSKKDVDASARGGHDEPRRCGAWYEARRAGNDNDAAG